MRNILEIIPEGLWDQLPSTYPDMIADGVFVTVTTTPSNELVRKSSEVHDKVDGQYRYFCIISWFQGEDFPEYEWELVSWNDDVADAKEDARKKAIAQADVDARNLGRAIAPDRVDW